MAKLIKKRALAARTGRQIRVDGFFEAHLLSRHPRVIVSESDPSSHEERDDRADEKNNKEYFRNAGGASGNSTEPKYGRDDRDNEEYDRIVKHLNLLVL